MGLFKIIHESYSLSLAIFGYKQKKKKNRWEDGRCMERRMGSKMKRGLLEEKIGV